ncbi:hypothetical protein ABW13_16795 [Pluralibacter gergoviae]|nr:hypothetical protein ABW13_16795 [Pluralibacter gergoviae]
MIDLLIPYQNFLKWIQIDIVLIGIIIRNISVKSFMLVFIKLPPAISVFLSRTFFLVITSFIKIS